MIKNYFRILKNPHAYLQAILKAHVKFQTVVGVKRTRYLLPIDFCNIRTQKMSKFKIKNNFRILEKTHAYLQTILKAPVKFQNDWTKTVGGVKETRYLQKIWKHAPRKAENSVPPVFFEKAVDNRFSSKRRGTTKMEQVIVLAYVTLQNIRE